VRAGTYALYSSYSTQASPRLRGSTTQVSPLPPLSPPNLCSFDRAFLSLYKVVSGDPWPAALPLYDEDGSVDTRVRRHTYKREQPDYHILLSISARFIPHTRTALSTPRSNAGTVAAVRHAGFWLQCGMQCSSGCPQ
jgi:hypothetical protein